MVESELDSGKLLGLMQQQKDWSNSIIFDANKNVIASTIASLDSAELDQYINGLNDRDWTVGHGFTLLGQHFDVHRWHPPLVYGRRGNAEEGEGIAMCRAMKGSNQIFMVITYLLPIVSARAIPQMIDFLRKNVGTVEIPSE